MFRGDIDIDVADRDTILAGIAHVDASMLIKGELKKHTVGVYFQEIPFDPRTNFATLNYNEAEEAGYQKVDILNNSIYERVRDEKHLSDLISTEPIWELFEHADIVSKLFHLSNHVPLVTSLKPKSVEELAMVLALIRPAKAFLANRGWDVIKRNIWKKPTGDEYYFKRSHAISYAMAIIVQLNIIVEEALSGQVD